MSRLHKVWMYHRLDADTLWCWWAPYYSKRQKGSPALATRVRPALALSGSRHPPLHLCNGYESMPQ